MTKNDLILLSVIASLTPNTISSSFVELGSFLGRSASVIAKHLPSEVVFYSVDTWDESTVPYNVDWWLDKPTPRLYGVCGMTDTNSPTVQKFLELVKLANKNQTWRAAFDKCVEGIRPAEKFKVFHGPTTRFNFPQDRDCVVFVDADHSYSGARTDLSIIPKNPNMLILGHDFNIDIHSGLVRAVLDHRNATRLPMFVIFPGTEIWSFWPSEGYWADKLELVTKSYLLAKRALDLPHKL